ncbi:MAG TPA: hypothetical protein DEF01_00685 [Gemmatimonadetes bacterium]|nr:hypothetical protein [Gemmatimonadota bacterium]HBV05224.1 hypothetical protein [Gemmatimonadota bacterium]HCO13388.1 hypothetical protein [Gemmatimonadota bacterium]
MRPQQRLQRTLIVPSIFVMLTACDFEMPPSGAPTSGDAIETLPMQGVHGQSPAASGGVPSVIMLSPAGASPEIEKTASLFTIDQFGLTFSPRYLLADKGDPITFTNSESDLSHNVRLRAFGDTIDVIDADANPGEQLVVQLLAAGGYDVICDMHPGMTAFIFVSEATHSVFAQTDGSFALDSVPVGTYTLQLWTAASGFQAPRSVEIGPGLTSINLEISG